MMGKELYFMVESGAILAFAREHVAEHIAQDKRNAQYLKEIGADGRYWRSILDGTVAAVTFPGEPPEGWRKPDRAGRTSPKKGSTAWDRHNRQTGSDVTGSALAKLINLPRSIRYEGDGTDGMSRLEHGLMACGVLWLSQDGPFAAWVPNIPSRVAEYEAEGYTVDDACKNWRPVIEGARPILKEEWEFLVAKFDMDAALRKGQAHHG